MIRFEEIRVGSGGETRCSRCHGASAPAVYRTSSEIASEIAAVCGSWTTLPGPNIVLTGAEPFGHPDLPALVSAAVEAGCRRICLATDAVALCQVQNAGGSLMAGVRQLRWTLLAGTPGVHDALVGEPGALEASSEGLRSFLAVAAADGTDVHVTAVVPVCRHNAHDLPAAAGLAVDAGADSILLRVEDGGLDLGSVVPWIVAACDTGVVNGVWVEAEGVPFCLLPGHALHVADSVRVRNGAKQPACSSCALDSLCGGAPSGASADQLALLSVPEAAESLAVSVARARGEVSAR